MDGSLLALLEGLDEDKELELENEAPVPAATPASEIDDAGDDDAADDDGDEDDDDLDLVCCPTHYCPHVYSVFHAAILAENC